ncbi:unnamed protein product [Microthlaspi erraticum]|uniref:F-box domain-containing protein n=1 Tax=Microthlaspi erraticum TaxID=1685480 RepID=A0A6D2JHP5_9BRAS|nr:unnamed protein product [Microthlaspi erraticum]
MTTTTISNLPRDLLEEVVSRVPSKCMRKVRLTCKKWNTLSKSRSFSKMRLGREASAARQGESPMVVLMDNDLHLVSFFVNRRKPYRKHRGKLNKVEISQVFHCEGLLLCILRDDTKVVVWNPFLGQTRRIETRYSYGGQNGKFLNMYVYALGYVNKKKKSLRSYKILRFFDYDVRRPGEGEKRFIWYEIYDFDSNSWKTLDVSRECYIGFNQSGVSLKGNTYFCANKLSDDNLLGSPYLVCFDYTSEKFGPLLRFPFETDDDDYVAISCVGEEKLAVLLTHNESNPYDLGVWITTKICPEEVSWSKFLRLDTTPHYPISSSCFFIDEEKKVVMGFDEDGNWKRHILSIVGEAGYLKQLFLSGNRKENTRPSPHVCSYVPSIVKIKQHEGGGGGDESKQQDKLEKRRYDEKMLRLATLEKPVVEESTQGKCFKGGKWQYFAKGKKRKRDN